MDDILKMAKDMMEIKRYSIVGDEGTKEWFSFKKDDSAASWLIFSIEIGHLLHARELVKEPAPKELNAGMYLVGVVNNDGEWEYCYAPLEECDISGLSANATSYIYVFESPAMAAKVCEYMDIVMARFLG